MNKLDKTYTDLISDAYNYYLDNFVEPKCPKTYDVQPDYYLSMNRERFEKTLFWEHARSVGRNGISEQYGVTIETKELNYEERCKISPIKRIDWENSNEEELTINHTNAMNLWGTPTKLTIITHNGQTQESYE